MCSSDLSDTGIIWRCDAMHAGRRSQQPSSDHRKGITPDHPDTQRGSTMSRKIISTFTAAAMSMSIALAVPVAVTAVSSVTVVSEAQAGFWKSVKDVGKVAKHNAKKLKRKATRTVAGNPHDHRCQRGWNCPN